MNMNAREMQDQRELTKQIQLDQRRRSMLESGPMRRFGEIESDGCPCCGHKLGDSYVEERVQLPWLPEKVQCGGRDPYASKGSESMCVILGDHMHCRCPNCKYSWFERTRYDIAKVTGRGAIRYDESFDVESEAVTKLEAPPTLLSVWGFDEGPKPGDVVVTGADGKRTLISDSGTRVLPPKEKAS